MTKENPRAGQGARAGSSKASDTLSPNPNRRILQPRSAGGGIHDTDRIAAALIRQRTANDAVAIRRAKSIPVEVSVYPAPTVWRRSLIVFVKYADGGVGNVATFYNQIPAARAWARTLRSRYGVPIVARGVSPCAA